MLDKVFSIKGSKISSFIVDEDSLKFTSSSSEISIDTFKENFAKKLSLSTKIEINFDSIKSIKKEDNGKDILIKYKGFVGFPSECEFSFEAPIDYDTFFSFLEKERYFTKINETLTPFRSTRNYLIGLLATIFFTFFIYNQAIKIANGTVEASHSGKAMLFDYVIGLLGDKGVLAVGIFFSGYLGYRIWIRYKNPPNQIKFLPPNI